MISIDNFVFDTIKRLKDLKVDNCLDIRSYKKNRKIVIEKLKDSFNLYEDGYNKEEFLELSEEELKKLLRKIEKLEFPRSNKLRFYILESRDSSVCRANYRDEVDEEEYDDRLKISIECSYSSLAAINSLIGENSINETINIGYADKVNIRTLLAKDTYEKLKKYSNDNIDINIYSY